MSRTVLKIILIITITIGIIIMFAKKDFTSLEVVNLKINYETFWKEASEKDFDEQLKLWNKHIEGAQPKFYAQVVHSTEDSSDWKERKEKSARNLFKVLPKLNKKIMNEYSSFDKTIDQQIKIFKATFKDANFRDLKIFAAPVLLRFNGQGSFIDEKPILAFGMDMISYLKDDPKVISGINYAHNAGVFYSHELFHMYHTPKQGLTQKIAKTEGTLANALWNEGLAAYVSGILNKDSKLDYLLMDYSLDNNCKSKMNFLKNEFAKDINKKLYDPNDRTSYSKWFLLSSKDQDIPLRAGYYLGYFVAKDLAEKHGLTTVVNWDYQEVQKYLDKYFSEYKLADK